MQITGELKDDKIIVKKPKDVGRLYNKSHFGKIISENKLQLDLLEGVFLLDEGKIKIFINKEEIDFQKLVEIATKNISDFEINYLTFKDLRKRGHSVKISKDNKYSFNDFHKHFVVIVFSERDILKLNETKKILIETKNKNKELWFAIVDEEGDITYYNVSIFDMKGNIKKHNFKKATGYILNDRIVIFDKNKSKALFEKEFFGKPFGEGIQLSFIEALYLLDNKILEIHNIDREKITKSKLQKILIEKNQDFNLKNKAFTDLKNRGLIVKTGFKFGAHFRAYSNSPDKTHAEYLVHVVNKDFNSIWSEISRAVRLAHSVNKEIIFARTHERNIDYIKLGRLRP